MRVSALGLMIGMGVIPLLPGCAGRSDNLASILNAPWAYQGQRLTVLVYPRDVGDGSYLACLDPCPDRAPESFGNTWVVPIDPDAFKGWNGAKAVRLSVVMNASSYAPNAVSAHFPIWLEDATPEDRQRP
ncbi:hypothetical protein [Brevundimonas sp.]|uniref:hypothetical protein n=1 Tax=Brevundimonas sp. TaxID=1871086 RepID=UPI0025C18320|nr:hypothetical protein [Brevundimonas sp.]